MKLKILMLLSLLCAYTLSAQLTITPGAQFSIFSDTKLTLQNSDLIINGNFLVATTSPISFTGDAPSFISGDGVIRLFKLEINKTDNQSVSLRNPISIGDGVFFISGFLNLNGFDLDLETTAHLEGEREDSRIIGPIGGQVLFTTNLNAPTAANPGSLGAIISSSQYLGNVTIKRGHYPQNGANLPNSISRYYDIDPTNNADLNATLRFNYFDGELNGISENSLEVFKSDDTINWLEQGFSSKDATANFVERTGIGFFSRFTLSNDNSPLPVHFILFNVNCEGGQVRLTWKAAQEQNSHHFDVERSVDGIHWTVIGNLPAANNSNSENSYSFTDNNPTQNGYYHIAKHDLNGRVQYSRTLRSSCNAADVFRLWPNPVHEMALIDIISNSESRAIIKIFDSKGALVLERRISVLQGNNRVVVDMKSLSNGVYSILAEWNRGDMKKSVQVFKQ